MKKYLLIISALFLTLSGFAQQGEAATDPEVQRVVEKFKAKYNLDEVQAAKMVKIQQRRMRNLDEIASLAQSDPTTFLQKRQAINKGTEVSVKMMLNKDQREVFDKDRTAIRLKKAEKMAELKGKGLSPQEMESHLLAIEDEEY
jgi:tRNA A37 N6-isopentenylltransferase MiaA